MIRLPFSEGLTNCRVTSDQTWNQQQTHFSILLDFPYPIMISRQLLKYFNHLTKILKQLVKYFLSLFALDFVFYLLP